MSFCHVGRSMQSPQTGAACHPRRYHPGQHSSDLVNLFLKSIVLLKYNEKSVIFQISPVLFLYIGCDYSHFQASFSFLRYILVPPCCFFFFRSPMMHILMIFPYLYNGIFFSTSVSGFDKLILDVLFLIMPAITIFGCSMQIQVLCYIVPLCFLSIS